MRIMLEAGPVDMSTRVPMTLLLLIVIVIIAAIVAIAILLAVKEARKHSENICPQCGKPIKNGKKFCTSCGAKIK